MNRKSSEPLETSSYGQIHDHGRISFEPRGTECVVTVEAEIVTSDHVTSGCTSSEFKEELESLLQKYAI